MNVAKRLSVSLCVVIALGLSACQRSMPPQIKPAPPLVSDCLVTPTTDFTDPPYPPPVLTDEWAKRIWAWSSSALGVITTDRTQWQGERTCVRGKTKTGAIR